ncbi:MAG: tetratricopeptide repeat protein [Armatimonadetes bacterium]|nr:tetratricopeptide repeat protein [Armatimonadota bacterium]
MTAENKEDARQCYEKAIDTLENGQPQVALRILSRSLQLDPGYTEALQLAADILQFVGREDEADLFREALRSPEEAQPFFDLGYHFSDVGLYDLAEAFFSKSLEFAPDDAFIHYEMGFCLSRLSRYAQAVEHLNASLRSEGSPETALLLSHCHLLMARPDQARRSLEEGRSLDFEGEHSLFADEMEARLHRFADEPRPFRPGLREWHYIQYGGILLDLYENLSLAGGRYTALWTDYVQVARTLTRACALLSKWNLSLDRVLYHGPESAPLGIALASLLEVPSAPYWEASGLDGSRLVVAANSQDLEDIREDLYPHQHDTALFAFALNWGRPQPVVPEMIGLMALICEMPWGERLTTQEPDNATGEHPLETLPPDSRPADRIAEDILSACRRMELDPGLEETVSFYDLRRPHVLLGNASRYPRRNVFSPDSPVPGMELT